MKAKKRLNSNRFTVGETRVVQVEWAAGDSWSRGVFIPHQPGLAGEPSGKVGLEPKIVIGPVAGTEARVTT